MMQPVYNVYHRVRDAERDAALASPEGQRVLQECHHALAALTTQRLASGMMVDAEGDVCTLGARLRFRRPWMPCSLMVLVLQPKHEVSNIIMAENDRFGEAESKSARYQRMRDWLTRQISKKEEAPCS